MSENLRSEIQRMDKIILI